MPWKLKNPAAADIAPDWLQPYCTQFLRKLSDQGYAAVTLRSYDGAAALLCHEVSRRGLRSDQLVGATLTKARAAALGRMHPNKYDQRKYCLDRSINALVEAGVAERPTPKKVRSSPLDRLRLEYVAYLRDQRGLTEATIYHCVCFLNRFMAFRFGGTLGNLNDITPHDIVDFLRKLRSDGKAPRDKTPPTHLRNLFRFLFWSGKTSAILRHPSRASRSNRGASCRAI
jgi:integrase/recombinase XerD